MRDVVGGSGLGLTIVVTGVERFDPLTSGDPVVHCRRCGVLPGRLVARHRGLRGLVGHGLSFPGSASRSTYRTSSVVRSDVAGLRLTGAAGLERSARSSASRGAPSETSARCAGFRNDDSIPSNRWPRRHRGGWSDGPRSVIRSSNGCTECGEVGRHALWSKVRPGSAPSAVCGNSNEFCHVAASAWQHFRRPSRPNGPAGRRLEVLASDNGDRLFARLRNPAVQKDVSGATGTRPARLRADAVRECSKQGNAAVMRRRRRRLGARTKPWPPDAYLRLLDRACPQR